jgi:hypothetical protein
MEIKVPLLNYMREYEPDFLRRLSRDRTAIDFLDDLAIAGHERFYQIVREYGLEDDTAGQSMARDVVYDDVFTVTRDAALGCPHPKTGYALARRSRSGQFPPVDDDYDDDAASDEDETDEDEMDLTEAQAWAIHQAFVRDHGGNAEDDEDDQGGLDEGDAPKVMAEALPRQADQAPLPRSDREPGIPKGVIAAVGLGLLMLAGAWIAPTHEARMVEAVFVPLTNLAELVMALCLFILTPLCWVRPARTVTAWGFRIAAWVLWLTLWLTAWAVVFSHWGPVALTIGTVVFSLVGLIPMAALAALFRSEWSTVGSLVLLSVAWAATATTAWVREKSRG